MNVDKIKQELSGLRSDQEQLMKRIEKLEQEVGEWKPERQNPTLKIEEKPIAAPKAPERPPSKGKGMLDLEFRIGGTWLNRIGVAAVILGLAYFLKYSFDNQWIGPTGRVLLGVLAGMIMMGAGEKLRHRYAGYAQGLLGGGSLALYFSIYTSYQFYSLIPSILAFLLLVLVTMATVFMAIRQNSLPIGILGLIGAYLTPFLIGSEHPSLWTLFSYSALLTAGVLAVSIYQKWPVFQYLSFVFNQFIFLVTWVGTSWDGVDGTFWPMFLFLVYNFILYLGVAALYNIRRQRKSTFADITLVFLNGFAFFIFSLLVLEDTWVNDYLGYYAVLLALVYLWCGKMAYSLNRADQALVYSLFLLAFVMITIAIPLQLSGFYISLAWLAEAVGLAYMAKQLNIHRICYISLLVLFLGLLAAWEEIVGLASPGYDVFLLNKPTLLILCSLLAIAGMAYFTNGVVILQQKLNVSSLLKALLLIYLFFALSLENEHFFLLQEMDFFLSPEQLSLSAIWLLYALSLFVLGIRKKNRYYRYAALGLMVIVILKAFFIDLAHLATIFKILLFIVLGLFLLGVSYFYQKKKESLQEEGGE